MADPSTFNSYVRSVVWPWCAAYFEPSTGLSARGAATGAEVGKVSPSGRGLRSKVGVVWPGAREAQSEQELVFSDRLDSNKWVCSLLTAVGNVLAF